MKRQLISSEIDKQTYAELVGKQMDLFLQRVIRGPVDELKGLGPYVDWMRDDKYTNDLSEFLSSGPRTILRFARGSGLATFEQLRKRLVQGEDRSTMNLHLCIDEVAAVAMVLALQMELIELGVDLDRLDEYVEWRRAGNPDADTCQRVFESSVLGDAALPKVEATAV